MRGKSVWNIWTPKLTTLNGHLCNVKYNGYVGIINKCDEIPAYLYLAKHISFIMLFIFQKILDLWRFPSALFFWLSIEQCIRAEMPLLFNCIKRVSLGLPNGYFSQANLVLIFERPTLHLWYVLYSTWLPLPFLSYSSSSTPPLLFLPFSVLLDLFSTAAEY